MAPILSWLWYAIASATVRSRRGFIALAMSSFLLVNGCAGNPSPLNSQLVSAVPSDPTTFNAPLNTSLFSRAVLSLINEGMLGTNGITGELEPALAESWEISDDDLRITFTLKENLLWSDGEPLTADDVVFTFNEIYLNEQVPTGSRDILRVGSSGAFPSVRKLSDRSIEFSVPEPFAPFLRFAGGIAILPEHILGASIRETDENGQLKFLTTWTTDTDPQQVIGAGMYRIRSYVPAQRVILERNPYYWRQDGQGNPQPYIEEVVLQVVPSDDAQLIAFRSGDLDSLDVKPEQFRLLKRQEEQGSYDIYNGGPDSGSRFLSFNLSQARDANGTPLVDPIKSKWFRDLRFRRAIAFALDRERMKNNIYRGLGEVQHSPIWSESPFYFSPEEGLKTYEYSPDRAQELLMAAGFTYRGDELFDSDGNRVRFTLLVKSEEKTRVDATVQIQQDLEQIGIRADLQIINFNAVLQKLRGHQWEAYVGGFGGGGIEPHGGFNIWYSGGSLHQFNQGPLPGEKEIQGWEVTDWEKEIDRLLFAGAQELDEAKRKEIYAEFQQVVAQQVPFIYLVNQYTFSAVRERVENLKYTAIGGAFWNLYELELDNS